MSRRFRNSCIRIIKSTGDPIFKALSDVRMRIGARSRGDPRDRENSCLCIYLLELSMIYGTMFIITFMMFYIYFYGFVEPYYNCMDYGLIIFCSAYSLVISNYSMWFIFMVMFDQHLHDLARYLRLRDKDSQ